MKPPARFNKVTTHKFIANVPTHYSPLLGINLKRKKIVKLYCILLFISKGRTSVKAANEVLKNTKKIF